MSTIKKPVAKKAPVVKKAAVAKKAAAPKKTPEVKKGIKKISLKERVMNKLDVLGDFKMEPIDDPELMASTVRKTKAFIPDVYYGKVVKVYDGDTITIATRLSGVG